MLKIRLKRMGRKKQPSYRIIAIDSRSRRDGKPVEELGHYNPMTKQGVINKKAFSKRVAQGAVCSLTVQSLTRSSKLRDSSEGNYK
jgi:small subunit ribosomal protein S16